MPYRRPWEEDDEDEDYSRGDYEADKWRDLNEYYEEKEEQRIEDMEWENYEKERAKEEEDERRYDQEKRAEEKEKEEEERKYAENWYRDDLKPGGGGGGCNGFFFWVLVLGIVIVVFGFFQSFFSTSRVQNSPGEIPSQKRNYATQALTQPLQPSANYITMTGCVNTRSLRVRSAPGTNNDVIAGLTRGTCVSLIGRNNDESWLQVSFDDFLGWVSATYIDVKGDASKLPITTQQ